MIAVVVIVVIIVLVVLLVWWLASRGSSPSVDAPTGLSASVSGATINLAWNAVTGASAYEVYISTSSSLCKANFGSKVKVTSNSASLNLAPGTYYFAVSALKACNGSEKESGLSSVVSATTPNCPHTNLGAPEIPKVEVLGDGALGLTWTAVPDAVGYKVYRAEDRQASPSDYDQLFAATASEVQFTGLAGKSRQSFVVCAVDGCDAQTAASPTIEAMVDCPSLPAPTFKVVNPGPTTISVKWLPVDGATKYALYVKRGSVVGAANFETRAVLAGSLLSFTYTGLTPETEYALAIASIGECGESVTSTKVASTKAQIRDHVKGATSKDDDGQESPSRGAHLAHYGDRRGHRTGRAARVADR